MGRICFICAENVRYKENDAENLQRAQDNMQWESQWWTPKEKQDSKDGWKVFDSEKPAEIRRWWEEDWHEDEWWAPKGSSNSVSNPKTTHPSMKKMPLPKTTFPSAKKTSRPVVKKRKGEDQSELVGKVDGPATVTPKDARRQEAAPAAPRALPLVSARSDSAPQKDISGFILKENSIANSHEDDDDDSEDEKANIPVAESPRERVNPKGDSMISPFEDPKPGPYSGARDEAPSEQQWEYHHLTGFGKYIDQGKDKDSQEAEKPAAINQEKNQSKEDVEEEEYLKDKAEHMEEEIQEKEKDRVALVPEENKYKAVDQFYGFGLESGSGASPSTPSPEKSESLVKSTQPPEPQNPAEKKSKESYNKGIIYDVIPSSPERTHSLKKDLLHSGNKDFAQSVKGDDVLPVKNAPVHSSVKKDLSKVEEEEEEIVSTKSNLQTSPNPPPPDLAEKKDSPTTSTASLVKTLFASSESAKTFIKSHPLTFCKLDAECRKGRMCHNGMCVCLPSDGCKGHYKPVCGSDGVQYPSFCELHRSACVRHAHLKVDYAGTCFMKHASEMQRVQKENYKDHLLPKPISQSAESGNDDDDHSDDDDGDYDGGDYSYDEEEEHEKEGGEKKKKEGENKSKEEVEEWLHGNAHKLKLDSKKIYDYSKDLKKASSKQAGNSQADPSPWNHVEEETGQEFKAKGGQKDGRKGGKPAVPATPPPPGSSSEDDDYQSDGGYKECTKAELAKFKQQLLVFHCTRFQEPHCKLEVKEERDYLTNLMFSYLDMNTDYQLSYQELKSRQRSEQFGYLNDVCELTDLIWYDDKENTDGRLSLDEFEQAFNNLDGEEDNSAESPKPLALSPLVHIVPTLATVGNGLELKCGLAAKGSDVVWRRHGVNIRDLANSTGELMVLDDGSLFFSRMGVHHMGNYSCEDSTDTSLLQVHTLKVQMPPIVKVTPHSQIQVTQMNAKMKCHAEGVPKPTISWHKNNVPISSEMHHYVIEDQNELLMVYRTEVVRDSGAYKCVAKNQAGTSEEAASVVIMKDDKKSWAVAGQGPNSGQFMVFHKDGFTVYSPDDCLEVREVHKDFGFFKFIPDNLDGPLRLCAPDHDCAWGQVVNVKDGFVYASQPHLNRVVVMETKRWNPMQVISTDRQPMELHYVEHLDQVWVLCWNSGEDDSAKTIVVIRDASKIVQHRAVHTQPVGNHFDQIQALFIAPTNDLRHVFDYGYVTHNGQQGLTKLDLDNMRYVKAVDLTPYGCLPRSLAFVPIGGHVVVECVSPVNHQTLQLVMDYITDAVISTTVLSGHPYVAPDSRHVVTVDDLTGKVSVTGINNEGVLEAAYEVTVSASISDVAFYPDAGEGYLLVLTSADDDDIITINLSTGKVGKLKGTKGPTTSVDWHPSPVRRGITTGDIFCTYLLAPSKASLAIVDMRFHQVACDKSAAPRTQAAIFVGH
ncbi:hypothetical protein ACOMHN_046784 [Nucella lapillus]